MGERLAVVVCCDSEDEACRTVPGLAGDSGHSFPYHVCGMDDVIAALERHHAAALIFSPSADTRSVVSVIAAIRETSRHSALPIACIDDGREKDYPRAALIAGATEVFDHNHLAPLLAFVEDLVLPRAATGLSGKMLLIEDSEEFAGYVIELCNEFGLETDLVTSVTEAIDLLVTRDYDLVVTDVVLDGTQSGLALIRFLRDADTRLSSLPILVISAHEDPVRRAEALRCGADAFLKKPFVGGELLWHLRKVLKGKAGGRPNPATPSAAANIDWKNSQLTMRETEICSAILLGMSDKSIAAKLGISFWTVRTHIQRVFEKLNVMNRRELIAKFRADD